MDNRTTEKNISSRRLFMTGLLVLICLMSWCTVSARPASAKTYKIRTAKDWQNIGSKKGGTFKVMKNISLRDKSQYLAITKGGNYVIDLNGHTVKTTYNGVALRVAAPLAVYKGNVTLKTSKKNGKLYGTETATISVMVNSKLTIQSGSVVNNAAEFRNDITSAIFVTGNARCYIKGKSIVKSIGNGVALQDTGKLYVTGNPSIRAGANEYTGQFMHYGNAVVAMTEGPTISLKGGSYGTKASPDIVNGQADTGGWYVYPQSADYPILDVTGKVLKDRPGYRFVDGKGDECPILPSSMALLYPQNQWFQKLGEKKVETWIQDKEGYYTIYVVKE